MFSRLQVTIPFADALDQMPKYTKFMKDILSKKKRPKDPDNMVLNTNCSAMVQNTLPRKEGDPGRVALPITIGSGFKCNALVDMGASINLIPLSVVKRLENIETKSTTMILQLADKSRTRPHGVVEDVLLKVENFLFPVDFVVMEMDEDEDTPIILGRPFMKTARMLIDVDEGIMKVRTSEEEVCFTLFKGVMDCNHVEEEICVKKDRVKAAPRTNSAKEARIASRKKKEKDAEEAMMKSCWDFSFWQKKGHRFGHDNG